MNPTTDADGRFTVPLLDTGRLPTCARRSTGSRPSSAMTSTSASGRPSTFALTLEVGGRHGNGHRRRRCARDRPDQHDNGRGHRQQFRASCPGLAGESATSPTWRSASAIRGRSGGRTRRSPVAAVSTTSTSSTGSTSPTRDTAPSARTRSFHGSLGNATPFDFVKEVQVKTAGYQAEFGQSMGGIVNVITKSGSNAVPWVAVRVLAARRRLEGTWDQFQSVNGTIHTLSSQAHDAGIEGGGSIIRDRLFFFGALDRQWETRTFQAPIDRALFNTTGYDRERRNLSYAGKGTLQTGGNQPDRRVCLRRSVKRADGPSAALVAAAFHDVFVQRNHIWRSQPDSALRRGVRKPVACRSGLRPRAEPNHGKSPRPTNGASRIKR